MKSIIPYIIFGMLLSACSLFDEEEEFPNCDQELINKVETMGTLRILVEYEMPYTPEDELTEEEIEEQREAISDMHQKFYEAVEHKLEDYIGITNKFESSPNVSGKIKQSGLEYICQLDMVSSVRETRTFTTN